MADNVTTQIESKTRVSRHINLSSLYFIVPSWIVPCWNRS